MFYGLELGFSKLGETLLFLNSGLFVWWLTLGDLLDLLYLGDLLVWIGSWWIVMNRRKSTFWGFYLRFALLWLLIPIVVRDIWDTYIDSWSLTSLTSLRLHSLLMLLIL